MLRLDEIKQIQVELTTRCNARCPMCMRNYRGLDHNDGYPVTELTLAQIQQILDPAVLAMITRAPQPIDGFLPRYHDFQGILFNGNLGDFSAARDAAEIVEYLVAHKVRVHINTNGSARSPDWWARFAHPLVTVGFALDGLEDTHHLYRQDTDWQKILRNAGALIRAGGRAVWRFIPFDHNRHQEQACRELAESLGFERFENIYDGRDRGPAYHRDGTFSHWIGDRWSTESSEPPPVQELLHNHITWYAANTVRHPKDTAVLDMQCQHKRNRDIYIAADGSVYPCCYLGFYPKTMNHPGNRELAPLVQDNNALEHGLERSLQWFDKIEQTWQHTSIAAGRTYKCVVTCNRA